MIQNATKYLAEFHVKKHKVDGDKLFLIFLLQIQPK